MSEELKNTNFDDNEMILFSFDEEFGKEEPQEQEEKEIKSNNELKPCPFCGEIPGKIESGELPEDIQFWIECEFCKYYFMADWKVEYFNDEQELIKAWNNRPIEDKLNAEIGWLVEDNRKLEARIDEMLEGEE